LLLIALFFSCVNLYCVFCHQFSLALSLNDSLLENDTFSKGFAKATDIYLQRLFTVNKVNIYDGVVGGKGVMIGCVRIHSAVNTSSYLVVEVVSRCPQYPVCHSPSR
jgi:hypothetical protein